MTLISSLSRVLPVVLAWAIILAVACGGGDATGPSASSVTGIAGDNQVGPTGVQLALPLSFVVLGSSGQPLQGVTVNWTVTPAGGATFAPPSSTTDAQGTASTDVTLGGIVGELVIRGNLPGLQPVVFHALALDPCLYVAPYTLGATVSGTLATTDCSPAGWYYDFYQLDLPPGQQSLRISMSSATFDTWVDLFRFSDGTFVGFDDDIQATVITNSQLDIILPGDSYVIGANSYLQGATGSYTMTAATRSANMNGCREVWVLRGVTVTDAIATTDCPDTAGGTDYYDVARIWLTAGTVLTIAERSTAVNAMLKLYRVEPDLVTRTLVSSNDDSLAGNTNSFIAYTVPTSAPYDVFIGTSVVGETGAYTFDVSASTTLSAPAAGDTRGWRRWRGAEPLALPPLRLPKGLPRRARSR
jgi:hypothetical protein